MEKKSRFELIKIVEAQKEQLARYETRLRGKEMSQAFKFILCDFAKQLVPALSRTYDRNEIKIFT